MIFPFLSGICDGYLRPRLRVGRTRLNPVVLFVGFLAGAVSMGLFGLLIGPIIAAFLVALYREVTSGDDRGRISVG
ncbi:MAG: AI-2E family transporter [Methanomicrobiales archaeon]